VSRAAVEPADIRPAQETEADLLSALIMQSKAHWGYSIEALESWRPELSITPASIRKKPVFVAIVEGEVAGCYSLAPSAVSWALDNLWVLPRFMRRGVGRALVSHALQTAARGGASEVTVDADPNAETFYLDCGAIRCGEVAAPIAGQPDRVRPQLAFQSAGREGTQE
jgi:GNAT superfamily N-acetyltransferase